MAPGTNPPRTLRSVLVVVIIVLVLIVVGIWLVNILANQLSGSISSSSVQYDVEGTAEQAVITYTKADGTITQPLTVRLPWRLQVYNMPSGKLVILTAVAVEKGNIKCTIRNSGLILDSNTNNPFVDKALCGGYIR